MRHIQNYDSVNDIKSVMTSLGLNMSKRFGQNFLISHGARSRIIDLLDADSASRIWEIGPGLGAMTHMLIDKKAGLTVFEIDHGFIRYLESAFSEREGFRVVVGDFVKSWPEVLVEDGVPDRILGNLPYNSASAMIASLIEESCIPEKMVVTVQKEMGQRMTAIPGTKNYSSFSMLCQYVFTISNAGDLKPGAFYPSPEISSSIMEMHPHNLYSGVNASLYFKIIRDLFLSRRKKISNNLKRGWTGRNFTWEVVENALDLSGISPDDRGENIPVENIVNLTRNLDTSQKQISEPII